MHRYDDPADQELAGLLAVSLAYGRVDLFRPVLARVFDHLDAHGGPHAYVLHHSPEDSAPLHGLVYRWNRGTDLADLLSGMQGVMGSHGSLEALFDGPGSTRDRLIAAVSTLRAAIGRATGRPLTRGVRYLVPSPATGSACKRWNLYLRWMVRPPTEGVDRGLWTILRPADLIMPVDVHIHRIARFLGLTDRATATWATAEAITASLRRFDPQDPVRYDFALCHLGISKACLGHRDPTVCPACPLDAHCRAPLG